MEVQSLTDQKTCQTCDGPLTSGPFGLRCARCVLSLVEAVENDEHSYVAELFREVHLEGQVAKGGFGAVYRAQHRRMKRTVALKFLDTLLARNPEAVALFEQEMISVGALDHPGQPEQKASATFVTPLRSCVRAGGKGSARRRAASGVSLSTCRRRSRRQRADMGKSPDMERTCAAPGSNLPESGI